MQNAPSLIIIPSSKNDSSIRVALVEDDVNFQNALIETIRVARDMTLIAVVGTRALALQMLPQLQADVLLVDLGLPDGSGIDVIRAAHVKWPACNIMVSTTFGDERHVMQSLEAGASGYLLKDSAPKNMLDEIRSLNCGGSPISPLIARQILMRFRQDDTTGPPDFERRSNAPPLLMPHLRNAVPANNPLPHLLSAREQEVLEFTTKGYSSSEIAKLMTVSHHTVLTYVRRIYTKLEVHSKAEAIYEARNQGLLPE